MLNAGPDYHGDVSYDETKSDLNPSYRKLEHKKLVMEDMLYTAQALYNALHTVSISQATTVY